MWIYLQMFFKQLGSKKFMSEIVKEIIEQQKSENKLTREIEIIAIN